MKPADRSLEIVAVGLGQAGGNIAAEFQRRGYRALAFNTAKTDLGALGSGRIGLPDAQRIYIGLEGFDGAGSDVEYGRECVAAHASEIRSAVEKHAASADVVVLAAGLGGGTGSCISEFAGALEGLGLPIVLLSALPHGHESGVAKVNALRGVHGLAQRSTHGWILADNERLSQIHHDVSMDNYFETINRSIVDPLDVFNRLNDRDATQPIRTLDGEDFRTLLLSGGVLSYNTRVLQGLTADDVLATVRESLSENPIMPAGASLEDVAYLGLAIEASEKDLAESPFTIYEEIAQHLKQETGGAAVYIGLYRQSAAEGTTVRVLASSHALPASIDTMLRNAEREGEAIQKKVERNLQALDLGGIDGLRLSRHALRRGARGDTTRGGVVSEPETREVKSEPKPAGAEGKPRSAEARVEPKPAEVKAQPTVPKAAKPAETPKLDELNRGVAADIDSEPPVDASRGRYERLAKAFKDATSDDKRLYIARELVAAQKSEEALVRFYAVNAMTRADAGYFRESLENATKDADSHVADLARRALDGLGSGARK